MRYTGTIKYGYSIYCIVINNAKVDESLRKMLSANEFQMDKFESEIITDGYSIFINNFIKNILYL
jgi:hypothetical protein